MFSFIKRRVYVEIAFRAKERAKAIREETAHINPENELLLSEYKGASDVLEAFSKDLLMWAGK